MLQLGAEFFMNQALKLAQIAFEEGEVPIGAVVVYQQKIIGKGYNQVQKLQDPTAHAEILAITAACQYLGAKFLNDCEIYITIEPCLMCYGAIEHSRLSKIYFGGSEPKTGFTQRLQRDLIKIPFESNILADNSVAMMQQFFEVRRG